MTRYAVALGSNLGDRLGHMQAAVEAIASWAEVEGVSALYETAPVGGPDQDPYLNAVVVVETPHPPEEMLSRLQAIERDRGRRRGERWGPRPLDLDLVAMSPGSVRAPGLEVPHPRAADRRFVLQPLCDVWPDAVIAEQLTARDALGGVADQEVDRVAARWSRSGAATGYYWVGAQLALFAAVGALLVVDGSMSRPGPASLIGLGVAVSGLVLMVAAALALGRAVTPLPEPKPGGRLVETGPYSLVRHPMYGGVILFFLGISLAVSSRSALAAGLLLIPFFWAKSEYEERRLRIAHPGYRSYRLRVRRRLIPFLV